MGKRLCSHGVGTYSLPSGHLEFRETFEACAAREVVEETGIKVRNIRFLTATNDNMPEYSKQYVFILIVRERKNEEDEPKLEPEKCEG